MRRHWLGATMVGLLAVLASSCGDDGDAATQPDAPWGRTFLSSEVSRQLVPGTQIRLELVDREVRVNAGCNHLLGAAVLDGDRLVVTDMGGTEMGCDAALHAQDDWLTAFLMGRPTWSIDGPTLTLTGDTDTIVLVDRETAEPDRPLEGTRWMVDGIIDGDSVSSVPGAPDVQATMTFGDGEVRGDNGCNHFSAGALVADGTVEIGLHVQTYKACDPPASTVEAAVRAVLDGTVTFEIEASQLTLTGGEGRGLTLHAAP